MIKKLKAFFSKGFAFLYVFLLYHLKGKKEVKNKKLLIIFGGHLGNAILNAELVSRVLRLYKPEDGWKVYLYINSKNLNLLKKVIDLNGISVLDIEYPFDDGGTDFKSTHQAIKAFKNLEFEKVVVNLAHIMPLAGYVVATLKGSESIGVFDNIEHEKSGLSSIDHNVGGLRWYFERAYSNPIKVDYNTHEYRRVQLILNTLGDTGFKTRIVPIPKLCNYCPTQDKYITITIDSSTSKKRFDTEKFAVIADYIYEKFEYKVCVTGAGNGKELYEDFISKVKYKDNVINCVGNTTFDQWIELLRGAVFHVGVDSGSIHMAASVGTQSFCIVGAWDGNRALPYDVDIKESNTCEPICVYMDGVRELPCYGCLPLSGVMGHKNEECYRRCQAGQTCICLERITAQNVLDSVNEWIGKVQFNKINN